jgi:hypothetical protein
MVKDTISVAWMYATYKIFHAVEVETERYRNACAYVSVRQATSQRVDTTLTQTHFLDMEALR